MGAVSLRETFDYLVDTRETKRFGRQAWLIVLIIITEILIVLKFDWELVTKPMPSGVQNFLIATVVVWFLWTLHYFYFRRFRNWSNYRAKLARLRARLTHPLRHSNAAANQRTSNASVSLKSSAQKTPVAPDDASVRSNGRSGESRRRVKVDSQ